MKHLVAGLLFALTSIASAAAQKPRPQEGQVWRPLPIEGGCTVVGDDPAPADFSLTWDQLCVAGRPIEGDGTLRVSFGAQTVLTLAGTFVAGVPHGAMTLTGFDAGGAPIREWTENYNMGCDAAATACTPYQPN